jgi:hypothetical protein
MDRDDFEGTLVLEQLAEKGLLEEFWEAVDADDTDAARALMKRAAIERDVIAVVVQKMNAADGED